MQVMLIPHSADDRLLIYGLVNLAGYGVDPATNRLAKCQPNYTLGFHTPVYRHLSWIKKQTRLDLCLEKKSLLLDSDALFDFTLFIVAYATATIILLSLISDQRAKFLRLDYSFSGNEGSKPSGKSKTKEKTGIFPIKVKVSLSLDKITK